MAEEEVLEMLGAAVCLDLTRIRLLTQRCTSSDLMTLAVHQIISFIDTSKEYLI